VSGVQARSISGETYWSRWRSVIVLAFAFRPRPPGNPNITHTAPPISTCSSSDNARLQRSCSLRICVDFSYSMPFLFFIDTSLQLDLSIIRYLSFLFCYSLCRHRWRQPCLVGGEKGRQVTSLIDAVARCCSADHGADRAGCAARLAWRCRLYVGRYGLVSLSNSSRWSFCSTRRSRCSSGHLGPVMRLAGLAFSSFWPICAKN